MSLHKENKLRRKGKCITLNVSEDSVLLQREQHGLPYPNIWKRQPCKQVTTLHHPEPYCGVLGASYSNRRLSVPVVYLIMIKHKRYWSLSTLYYCATYTATRNPRVVRVRKNTDRMKRSLLTYIHTSRRGRHRNQGGRGRRRVRTRGRSGR